MLLLLLPLLNSSSVKNFLLPFGKDKSSTSAEDETLCPICQTNPTLPFLALPCEHRCVTILILITLCCLFPWDQSPKLINLVIKYSNNISYVFLDRLCKESDWSLCEKARFLVYYHLELTIEVTWEIFTTSRP